MLAPNGSAVREFVRLGWGDVNLLDGWTYGTSTPIYAHTGFHASS